MIDQHKVKCLASSINELETLKEALKIRKEEFEEKYRDLIESIEIKSGVIYGVKSDIKLEAEKEFRSTGNKKLFGGIGIRESIIPIYEESDAFAWAKEHSLALSLDKKRFEQLAKTEDMEFVTKERKITVTFPKKIKLGLEE